MDKDNTSDRWKGVEEANQVLFRQRRICDLGLKSWVRAYSAKEITAAEAALDLNPEDVASKATLKVGKLIKYMKRDVGGVSHCHLLLAA